MEQRIKLICQAIEGLEVAQWSRVKQQVDMMYSYQAAKVQIDDLERLEANLNREFKGC